VAKEVWVVAEEWGGEEVQALAGTGCNKVERYIGGNKMEERLSNLFLRFQIKGFMPIEIPDLVKDVLDIIGHREICTMSTIDQELEELGWGINIMDNTTFELITSLAEGSVS
jgi:hypothetical protein